MLEMKENEEKVASAGKQHGAKWAGKHVWLYRMFRSGAITRECEPELFARLKIARIPEAEPEVARAKIVYFGEAAPWGAI